MQAVSVFWLLTVLCTTTALFFVLPAIWLAKDRSVSVNYKLSLSVFVSLALVVAAYVLYYNLGAGREISLYYNRVNAEQRYSNLLIRPIYARVQRAIIKNELNIALDLNDLELLLNFASVHSKLADGVLHAQVKALLESVLRINPQQITALNLLAVHAYKTAAYSQAINYWQTILQQFPTSMHGSALEIALKTKISEARVFESKVTQQK